MREIWMLVVIALVTAATRFIPFLVFGGKRPVPRVVTYLGAVLPCAVMGMLVVYCLKDVQFLSGSYGIPELLGCIIVAVLHIWKRNSLLSIGIGTVAYMLMVQLIF